MIGLVIGLAYLAVAVGSARIMFTRWRPLRTPIENCIRFHKIDYATGRTGHKHVGRCYRRTRADLTAYPFDQDHAAAWAALAAGAVWPVMGIYWLVAGRPAEVAPEKMARLEAERKAALDKLAQQEKEAGIGREEGA